MKIYVETAATTNNFYIDDAVGAVGGTVIKGAVKVEKYTSGDIDNNGYIDAFDMIFARRGLINGFSSDREKNAADVNGNGKYEINDAVLLQQYILGKIKKFK